MVKLNFERNNVELTGIAPSLAKNLEAKFSWFNCIDLNDQQKFVAHVGNGDCHAYPGMFHVLRELLEKNGAQVQSSFGSNDSYVPKHVEWEWTATPRVGQRESVEACVASRVGLVKAPPGAGKTCIMTGITVAVGGRTLLLTEREEPMLQAIDAYGAYTNIQPTLYCGKKKALSEVTVGTVQTFKNAIIKKDKKVLAWLEGVDLVLIDEAHHVATEQYATVLDALHDPKYIIGVSATPDDREDSTAMYVTAYLGNVVYEITYAELIDSGSLVPVTVFVEKIPKNNVEDEVVSKFNSNTSESRSYQDVREEDMFLNEYANQAAADFVNQCVESGMSCAVIVGNIQTHAPQLERLLPNAVPLYGGNADRKEIIRKLRDKEIMVVITTLFDEAVDVPSLDAVAVLAGGKSKIKLKQRIRSTRAFQGTTALGTYKKARGYVWMPYYQDKYLLEHSKKRLKEIKEVVAEHPLNRLEVIEL